MITNEPVIRHWTRDEYHRMAELGMFVDERVELVQGEILTMSPMGAGHATALELVAEILRATYGDGHWVRVQLPLRLTEQSEPEPDLAVVPGGPRDYRQHPNAAILVVEVSDTTLHFDRTTKKQLYAACGLPHYWILNLIDRQLETYSSPSEGRYQQENIIGENDTVTLPDREATVAVVDLLP